MKGQHPLFPKEQLVSEDTRKKWHERINFLLEDRLSDVLSEWESGFIQDIEKWLTDGKDLTLAQSSKLNEVFHRVEERIG